MGLNEMAKIVTISSVMFRGLTVVRFSSFKIDPNDVIIAFFKTFFLKYKPEKKYVFFMNFLKYCRIF